MSVESAVNECYSEGAKSAQGLCCPVNYDPELLSILPQEIIERDYGCGDPSRHVKPGDTVLDLGSGGGKICYMAAQLVGENGKVIGVDMNDDMLALAKKYQAEMADKIGSNRVAFHKGQIQDLAQDLGKIEEFISNNPIKSLADLNALNSYKSRQRESQPLIPDNSIDVVISNCVLNLVTEDDRKNMVNEIFRVLKPGGRVAISDIISDELVPTELKQDEKLWAECVTGAFQELEFIEIFKQAGFQQISYTEWDSSAWRIIQGIEFRSATLTAVKGDSSPCIDYGHAVIYRGPFSQVEDDEGHIFPRGERMAVCERTYNALTNGNLKDNFIGIPPLKRSNGIPWCSPSGTRRPASESKGVSHAGDEKSAGCC